ncbi:hypothetical protein LS74_010560 [Helicobacter magdeburgensis]|uniref:Uncharacterized protein n=1 Tax=Helicobacter magdeburgensis TaxID=471858 RepID=A0A4V6I170_9HELI|nr:hypothetical protein [Helicobacter magdeburgensis]TLD91052.1 hypothetical protein LS74_010560 [Helicobacter magdeburgensis]
MNAIQYGSEAGVLNQIAQGNSLRRVFGTGAGFQESYSAMANTQADMQNIQAKETARSAREHFKGIGTSSAEGSAYSRVSRLQADQRFEEMQGSTDAYETARSVNSNIAREQAQLGAASKFKSTEASLNNINAGNHQEAIDRLSTASAAGEAKKAFQSTIGFEAGKQLNAYNDDGTLSSGPVQGRSLASHKDSLYHQSTLEAQQEIGGTLQHSGGRAARNLARKAIQENNEKIEELESQKESWGRNMSQNNALLDGQIKEIKNANKALSQAVAGIPDKDGNIASIGLETGFTQIQGMSGGNVGSLNIGRAGMQGSFQSGISFSHNESRGYSYGVTASGGSTFAGLAHSAGIGMQNFAMASSALSAVGQIASTASMFGRVAGGVSSLMGGAGGDALMAAQQGVQRASARVASAQSQLNWATEQAAGTHQRFGGAYAGMNAQQIGAESARLQMGIHDMNMRVGRLNGIKGRLLDEGVGK